MTAARTSVQWLRDDVGSSAVARMEVPAPVLASTHLTPAVRAYLLWWFMHPDPAGRFAAQTRWLRWLPARLLLRTMFALGYEGLIYMEGETVIGHVFFQRRGEDLHGFSTAVIDRLAGSGYSAVMILDFVAHASQYPGVRRARVGTGANNTTRRFLERLKQHEARLGWRVGLDGWVTFSRG